MPKAKQILESAANSAIRTGASQIADAAKKDGWRGVIASLKSTTLWTSIAIAAVQGLGLLQILDQVTTDTSTLGLIVPIAVERLKKIFT